MSLPVNAHHTVVELTKECYDKQRGGQRNI